MPHSHSWEESGETLSHAAAHSQNPKPSSVLRNASGLRAPALYTPTSHPGPPGVMARTFAKNPTLI